MERFDSRGKLSEVESKDGIALSPEHKSAQAEAPNASLQETTSFDPEWTRLLARYLSEADAPRAEYLLNLLIQHDRIERAIRQCAHRGWAQDLQEQDREDLKQRIRDGLKADFEKKRREKVPLAIVEELLSRIIPLIRNQQALRIKRQLAARPLQFPAHDDEVAIELAAPNADPARIMQDEAEARGVLQMYWQAMLEFGADPAAQRKRAVLLLKDPREMDNVEPYIHLLVERGIATWHELAVAIGIEEQVLQRLWRDIPLEDREIAMLLKMTPKSVQECRSRAWNKLREHYPPHTPI